MIREPKNLPPNASEIEKIMVPANARPMEVVAKLLAPRMPHLKYMPPESIYYMVDSIMEMVVDADHTGRAQRLRYEVDTLLKQVPHEHLKTAICNLVLRGEGLGSLAGFGYANNYGDYIGPA